MPILSEVKKMSPSVKAAFFGWLKKNGWHHQYNFAITKGKEKEIYIKYFNPKSKLTAAFEAKHVKYIQDAYAWVRNNVDSEDEVFSHSQFKAFVSHVRDKYDEMIVDRYHGVFINSAEHKAVLAKDIDGTRISKEIGFKKGAERLVTDAAVSLKVGQRSDAEKSVRRLSQDFGPVNDAKGKPKGVKALVAEIEKKIKKNRK